MVDNNYIGPGARVALGIAAGDGVVVLRRQDVEEGAEDIRPGESPGVGLALLYSFVLGGHCGVYHLIPAAGVVSADGSLTTRRRGGLRHAIRIAGDRGARNPGRILDAGCAFLGRAHPWILFNYVFSAQPRLPWRLTRLAPWGPAWNTSRQWPRFSGMARGHRVSPPLRAIDLVATVFAFAFYVYQFCFARARLLVGVSPNFLDRSRWP